VIRYRRRPHRPGRTWSPQPVHLECLEAHVLSQARHRNRSWVDHRGIAAVLGCGIQHIACRLDAARAGHVLRHERRVLAEKLAEITRQNLTIKVIGAAAA